MPFIGEAMPVRWAVVTWGSTMPGRISVLWAEAHKLTIRKVVVNMLFLEKIMALVFKAEIIFFWKTQKCID
ncbi:MAG: hypothetical protein ACJAZY_002788 [Spirosomataceae bacterium]|jgi:hypothetical protein